MNKIEGVEECVVKIDEIVIASCFLMAGLQGRQRRVQLSLFPLHPILVFRSLPMAFTSEDNLG